MAATPKMVQLLKALPEKEFRRFKVYLKSPFFNKNPKILRLLEARKSEGDNLEALQKRLFPKEQMSKQVFKNLLSTLLKHYERFLANLQLEEDEGLTKILAAEKAGQMGLNKVVLAVSPEIEVEEIGKFSIMAIHLLPKCHVRQVEANFQLKIFNKCFPEEIFQKETEIIKISNSLTYLFMLSSRQVFEEEYIDCPKCVPRFWQKMQLQFHFSEHPLVKIYQKNLLLSTKKKTEDYFNLKESLFMNLGIIHKQHSTATSIVLSNHCRLKFEGGDKSFYKEYVQLKLETLRNKIGDISNQTVRNCITVTCNLKEFEIAHSILEEFKENLDVDTSYYSLAVIEFYQGNFKLAIDAIREVSDSFKSNFFPIRQLILNSYLMLGELEFVKSNYEAIRQFLDRNSNRFPSQKLLSAKTYLKHFHKILKLEKKKSILSKADYRSGLAILKSEIENIDKIMSRNQLIFIIEQLEERAR